MVSLNPEERPTIDEILTDPWMKEINDLKENEYKILEKEVYEDFRKREKKIIESNETITTNVSYSTSFFDDDRATTDYKTFFDLSIKPKFNKTGLNMNNYIKIKGELNTPKFMNQLANTIKKKF